MSNPAQGAVGAETMAAGLTLTFDPSKLFDTVAGVADGGAALGCRIVGIMLAGGQTSFREDVGLAFYGVTATPAPRTDGGMTAGEDAWTLSRAFDLGFWWGVGLYTSPQSMEDSRAVGRTLLDPEFDGLNIDLDGWDSFQSGDIGMCEGKRRIKEALDRIEATPAQPAGTVPDGLRALICENRPEAAEAALEWANTLLATHPAGQSTGQGAGQAPDELTEIEVRGRAAALISAKGWTPGETFHFKAVLDLMTEHGMALAFSPPQDRCAHPDCGCDADSVCGAVAAPDSPLTGPVGVEEIAKALYRHDYGAYPDQPEWGAALGPVQARYCRLASAALAARPAAPEAQGAWRPIKTAPKDGTEFAAYENGDVYKCHWKGYDDGEGRWSEGWFDHVNESLENPTHWCPLDNLPAPPSSGQGGR